MRDQLANFQQLHQQVLAELSEPRQAQAEAAWQHFAGFNFPKARHEAWKYTNVRPLFTASYNLAPTADTSATAHASADISGAIRISFVDGQLLDSSTDALKQAGGLLCKNADLPQEFEPYFADVRAFNLGEDASFAYLNQAMAKEQYCLYLPRGCKDLLIHLDFIASIHANESYHAPDLLVFVDDEASATLVESYASDADAVNYFVNPLFRCMLARHAKLSRIKLIQDSLEARHVSNSIVNLADHATYNSFHAMLGGKLVRDDITVNLVAKHADANLSGVYLGAGKQHLDSHCLVDHLNTHGTSKQFYRGILTGQARAVFDSKVWVGEGAIKSSSQQTNNNLLLSKTAEVDTKPELQIYNDDVACAHGATIGELDHEQLFYLISRGLDEQSARHMLTSAFACAVVREIEHEAVQQWMLRVVEDHLQDIILMEHADDRG